MITVNKNTTQSPLSSSGRTGKQSIKFIPAPRVYLCPPDMSSNPAVFFGPSYGATIPGFTDLGVVDGNAVVTINTTTNDIFVGVDKFCVGEYSLSKNGRIDFTLSQFDDQAFEDVTGIAPHAFVTGTYSRYLVGGQPLLQTGLLLVLQNKLDGKELQFYNPKALLLVSYDGTGDAMTLKVSGILPGFKGGQLLGVSVVDPGQPLFFGYGITLYGLSYGDPT